MNLGFTEPYLFNKNVALGVDLFRQDYNSFNFSGSDRQTTYSQVRTGFQIRAGIPLTEYWSLSARYGFSYDEVGLDESQFFTNGVCDNLKAGRYLCDSIGNRITSSVGYSVLYNSLNSSLRPTAGSRFSFSQDFAGLGGDVKYIKTTVNAAKYYNVGKGFVFSLVGEGGYIFSLEKSRGEGIDKIRITDRFLLGEPQFRGFQIRGVGPRVLRQGFTLDPTTGKQILITDRDQIIDDALGGRAYYLGRAELELPLGSGARELGLRPSIYAQIGSLFGITRPLPTATFPTITDASGNVTVLPINTPLFDSSGRQLYIVSAQDTTNMGMATTCAIGFSSTLGGACSGSSTNSIAFGNPTQPFKETFLGNSPRPRVSIGVGVNWNSPFGPLRIDLAKAIVTQPGDDPKLITFNVGDTVLMKLLLSTCAIAALFAAGTATAQTNGIATVSPDVAILSAKAFTAANGQISTTYKTQLDQAAAQDTTLNTQIRTLIDTNKDGQISQAELQAGQNATGPIGTQVKAAQDRAQPAIERLRQPAVLAQAYALEQIALKYDPALQTVAKQKNAGVVLTPNAIEYAPPATDITQAVVAEIDRTTPTVPITPPANWQPSQTTVQLLNQYRQAVYASEARRQQAAQQGGAAAATPTPSATGGTPAPGATAPRGRRSDGR